MNEWNLDALYTSFQDKNFQEDLNTLKDLNKNYPTYRSEKTEASLHKIIETKIEIEKRIERLHFLYSFLYRLIQMMRRQHVILIN